MNLHSLIPNSQFHSQFLIPNYGKSLIDLVLDFPDVARADVFGIRSRAEGVVHLAVAQAREPLAEPSDVRRRDSLEQAWVEPLIVEFEAVFDLPDESGPLKIVDVVLRSAHPSPAEPSKLRRLPAERVSEVTHHVQLCRLVNMRIASVLLVVRSVGFRH